MSFSENFQEYLIYGTAFAAAGFGISFFGLDFSIINSILLTIVGLLVGMFFGYFVDVLKSNSDNP